MNIDGLKRVLAAEDKRDGTSKLLALEETLEDLELFCLREVLDAYAAALWGEDLSDAGVALIRRTHPRIIFVTSTETRVFRFYAKREVNAWLIAASRAKGPNTRIMAKEWENPEWNDVILLSPYGTVQSVYMLAAHLFPIIPHDWLMPIAEAKDSKYDAVAKFIRTGEVNSEN
jgi:hypothetical protein